MIEIPFFNHYSHEYSPTAESFNLVLEDEGIFLLEKPCLCRSPLESALPPVVLVHGARGVEGGCYKKIRESVIHNPHTRFFLMAFSLGFSEHAIEKVSREVGPYKNYTSIVGLNTEESFAEIIRLAKQQL